MMKNCFLWILILLSIFPAMLFSQDHLTRVFTDFNGGWNSQTQPSVRPNNSHNMLGFTWKGNTYSTGVNDVLFATVLGSNSFTAQNFQAFPSSTSPTPNSSTYIGVGSSYGGGDGNITPVPVTNNLLTYITDGIRGLDLGTAIFNFPANAEIRYEISSINPASIGDGIPDLLITQIGQASNDIDTYRFVNNSNVTVGNVMNVTFGSVPEIGTGNYKFYSPMSTPPNYISNLYGPRPMRFLAFDWSELGITTSNYIDCKYFVQKFSGSSDIAFTAYNRLSSGILQSISGTVYNDNNAGTPNGTPYANAQVRLYDSANNLVATTTTASNGVYIFPNRPPGNYRIELTVPTDFQIVGSADGDTNNNISVTLMDIEVHDQDFGINQPPVANNDTGSGEKGAAIQIDLTANDVDPNSGSVVASTINLIPPSGAANFTMDGNGNVKSFSVTNIGNWSVNTLGVLTFTPVSGFSGTPNIIGYTIKDTAGLLSNQATITFTNFVYCSKSPVNTTGGNPSKVGITDFQVKQANWPEKIPNGFLTLESSQKGFVITRIQNSNLITDAKEGMIVYDVSSSCVKLFNGTSWKCIARDCNE